MSRFGWTGPNCNEYSIQVLFYSISQLLYVLISLFLLVTVLRTLYINRENNLEGVKRDPILITAIFVLGGAFSVFLSSVLILSALIDPTRFEIVTFNEISGRTVEVGVTHGKVTTFSLFAASIFFTLAALQVFFTWHKILIRITSVSGEKTRLLDRRLQRALKALLALIFIAAVLVVLLDERDVSILLVGLASLSLAIAYPLAYFAVSKTIEKVNLNNNAFFAEAVSLIRYCCLVNAVSLVGIGCSVFLVFLLYRDMQERLAPGEPNYVLLLRELTGFCGLYMLLMKSWYINTMLPRKPIEKSCLLRVVWDKWDRKHEFLAYLSRNTHVSSAAEIESYARLNSTEPMTSAV